MSKLTFGLVTLCRQNREGSYATQSNRKHMLHQMGRSLWTAGYRMQDAGGLRPKHVDHLVAEWNRQELDAGTMKNRLGVLRWWATKVNKPGMVAKDNKTYGVAARTAWKGDKGKVATGDQLAALPNERMGLAVRLMQEFGLRTEESLKFQPVYADQGKAIKLKGSWCKGGRAREIPIVTDRQRSLLDEVRAVAGGGSMIPPELSYIAFRKNLEHATLAAGLNNLHGLRHGYAQSRYAVLYGAPCPARGGVPRRQLRGEPWQRDTAARQQISHELGHGRIDVTKAYLG